MNVAQICAELFAGKTVAVAFASTTQALTFRTRLYVEKRQQEMALSVLGMPIERKRLSFQMNEQDGEDGDCIVTMKFIDPPPLTTYKVILIDDMPPGENNNENV